MSEEWEEQEPVFDVRGFLEDLERSQSVKGEGQAALLGSLSKLRAAGREADFFAGARGRLDALLHALTAKTVSLNAQGDSLRKRLPESDEASTESLEIRHLGCALDAAVNELSRHLSLMTTEILGGLEEVRGAVLALQSKEEA
jgi:hypothetical protein